MDEAESGGGDRDSVLRIGEVGSDSASYWRRGTILTSIFMLRILYRLYSTWSPMPLEGMTAPSGAA